MLRKAIHGKNKLPKHKKRAKLMNLALFLTAEV